MTLKVTRNNISKNYKVRSEKYPIEGFSTDSEEEAREDLLEKEEKLEESMKKGSQKEDLFRCSSKEVQGPSYPMLKVKASLNSSALKNQPSIYMFHNRNFFLNFSLEDGFIVWEDYVVDNYMIRSMVEALQDNNIEHGMTAYFDYKIKIFDSVTRFWD